MKKALGNIIGALAVVTLLALALLLPEKPLSTHVYAQAGPTGSVVFYTPGSDPCLNPSVDKQSVVINISTATTTEIVASVVGKTTTVCAVNITAAGTTPTATFKTGTKVSTACDTTPTSISGAMVLPVGFVSMTGDGGLMNGIAGGEICITSAATTNLQGTLTYAQL